MTLCRNIAANTSKGKKSYSNIADVRSLLLKKSLHVTTIAENLLKYSV